MYECTNVHMYDEYRGSYMNVGQLFMFGFYGYKPTKEILRFIKEDNLGGVILFKRNIESADQLKALTSELQDAAGGELLIGIDQEGGRVSNLPNSIIDVPPMEKLGRSFLEGESAKRAHLLGHELGEKLLELGINIDFAPVLDVRTNPNNPIIGSRSFSDDPEVVAILGCEVARGMKQAGLISCGKHFPGHGDTSEDSHLILPIVELDIERLKSLELMPFETAIEKGIPSLMSAHVVYADVDDKPATLSKKILTDILRDDLGFKGVLFSDDLEMKAISDNYDMGDVSVTILNAGCDILLICHREDRQNLAIQGVREAIEKGTLSKKHVQKSIQRIESMKRKYL